MSICFTFSIADIALQRVRFSYFVFVFVEGVDFCL